MIQLMRKRIDPESLEVLYDRPFSPESFAEDFELKDGKWHTKEELGHYQSYTFKMYSGTVQDITMRFRNHLMNVVVNKFGSQNYAKAVDADHFEITVPVAVSPQFYSWIFGLRDGVEIVSPPAVREGMRTMLEKALEHYE